MRKDLPVKVCRGLFVWVLVLLFALLLSQGLRSHLSFVILIAILLLPLAEALYLALAVAVIRLFVRSDEEEAAKKTPVSFELMISNDSLLPLPFVEADVIVPDKLALRDMGRTVKLSLPPRSSKSIRREVSFPYRGCYKIGVERVRIFGLFRMFSVVPSLFGRCDITVLPRRLVMSGTAGASADTASSDIPKGGRGSDRYEVSGIREYQPGDGMKTIHWKLSSKTQELLVREYALDADRRTIVLCDTAAHYDTEKKEAPLETLSKKGRKKSAKETTGALPESIPVPDFAPDTNEYIADIAAEASLAICTRELRSDIKTTLVWADRRADGGYVKQELTALFELERLRRTFASFPLGAPEEDISKILPHLHTDGGTTMAIITGNLSPAARKALIAAASADATRTIEVYFINPADKIANKPARDAFSKDIADAVSAIRDAGITLSEIKL